MRRLIISPATPGWDAELVGTNINGPSLVRVPDWSPAPLGRYHLYFAHHQGQSIRLAYADHPLGPWTIHTPGVLQRAEAGFDHHIASPDVHIDHAARRWVMYFHGDHPIDPDAPWEQSTLRAVSEDGLAWRAEGVELGESYFRVFEYSGCHYAIAKGGALYRSRDGGSSFEIAHNFLVVGPPGHGRHWAVLREGDRLRVWFSRFFDAPEHICEGEIDLTRRWTRWEVRNIRSVLRPELPWEGAGLPVEPSRIGAVHHPVNQLRDPAIFRDDDGALWLLYSVAGESGIGLARLPGD